MKKIYDLSQLDWTLTGWIPYLWRLERPVEINSCQSAEISTISANVPGSVQTALLSAGIITDWNYGLNFRECQWVENLHWVYEAKISDEWIANDISFRLECLGLDGSGWIRINGKDIAEFSNSFVPHVFDLTEHLEATGNVINIIFGCPPRWLGQFGYTSKITDWKVRFNYTWDWIPRLVQIGIWDNISLVATDGSEICEFRAVADIDDSEAAGVKARGKVCCPDLYNVNLTVSDGENVIGEQTVPARQFNTQGIMLSNLSVERWWPNLHGDHKLYNLTLSLHDDKGGVVDQQMRRVGFRRVSWKACEDAPPEADPWICVVNDKPIFLQGANWTPIRPNFADVTVEQYRERLSLYADLGFNILRVWGGAFLEKECFYDLCDELGLMVWQEYPLSSSGCDDYPPEKEEVINEMSRIAGSYISRRQHHVSLIVWCSGNELITRDGSYMPVAEWHPMISALKEVTQREDPTRRFLVTSPSGPKVHAHMSEYGKGVHWDVHGPWLTDGNDPNLDEWKRYWQMDDALLRSETGNPGASPADIIEKYSGDYSIMPISVSNPLWRRPTCWWVDYPVVTAEHGREPNDLEEYVEWSQSRQAKALSIAVKARKDKFPKCGGIIIWMGHDCFPCASNTSIIDFEGRPKAAALAVSEIFRKQV